MATNRRAKHELAIKKPADREITWLLRLLMLPSLMGVAYTRVEPKTNASVDTDFRSRRARRSLIVAKSPLRSLAIWFGCRDIRYRSGQRSARIGRTGPTQSRFSHGQVLRVPRGRSA